MKKLFLSVIIACTVLTGFAQHDAKTKELLDKVSEKTQAYKTIKIKFDYTLENLQNDITDTYSGMIFIKNKKYKLFLMGNQIFFDGSSITTYNPEFNEATINEVDTTDKSNIGPADLLTIYQKGFKYRLLPEENEDGKKLQVVDLVPEKPKEQKYSRVILKVEKESLQIFSLKYFGKDGNRYTIKVNELSSNISISDNLFVFDQTKFPDVEVTDLRE